MSQMMGRKSQCEENINPQVINSDQLKGSEKQTTRIFGFYVYFKRKV